MSDGERIAQAFVAARRTAGQLRDYPGAEPTTLAEAYAIQAHAIALRPDAIGGWKVGRIQPPLDTDFGTNRLAGPIFADTIVAAAGAELAMPVFATGFAAAEAEYLLRVAATPNPAKHHYTIAEAAALIDAVHVGIEIASSPFPGINAGGPAVTISDFGNNHGLVVGAAIEGWRDGAYLGWPVRLDIDGVEAGHASAYTMLDGPIGAAAFLFGLLAERGIAVRAGQWISSGAVTGVHEVRPGQRVTARFGDDLTVRCAIDAAAGEPEDGDKGNGSG
jgi:2-keto-4-pentenoate hydratase